VSHFGMFCWGTCAIAALALMSGSSVSAGGGQLKVGDKAPAFEGPDDQGQTFKSNEHVGKKIVVVYFYPADFTKGCTDQACGFRDNSKALTDKGVEVIGVSGDSVKTHAAFKKEHMLPFTLVSDGTGAIASKFGVPFTKTQGKAKFKDETIVREGTAQRWTVVIDTKGNVAAVYAVKDAGGDSKKILELVDKLQK
jgi:thioredoxin-dependent peroxiredoxin